MKIKRITIGPLGRIGALALMLAITLYSASGDAHTAAAEDKPQSNSNPPAVGTQPMSAQALALEPVAAPDAVAQNAGGQAKGAQRVGTQPMNAQALRLEPMPAPDAPMRAEDTLQSTPGMSVVLLHDPTYNPWKVEPPPGVVEQGLGPVMADDLPISVLFNPGDTCPVVHPGDPNPNTPTWVRTPWPANAQAAMNYAALIWSRLLNGSIMITVDACWYTTLAPNVLGAARPTGFLKDFTNAPQANTWYPITLANELADKDLNGVPPEIHADFSAGFNWYFGTDGNVPAAQVDFLSVALHEIGHGMGFSGGASWDDGANPAECNGTVNWGCVANPPFAYDRFVRSGSTAIVGGFANPSLALGGALVGNNLNFNGGHAIAANGNSPPRLFAPNPWQNGSSYSHLDEATFNNTGSALMTPSLANGESLHHPGPVAIGVLADMGWSYNSYTYVAVDGSNTGFEDGTFQNPYNTVEEGVAVVNQDGLVYITAGNYNERLTIRRSMFLLASDGVVTIGK